MSQNNEDNTPIYRMSYGLVGITGHDFGLVVFSSAPKVGTDHMTLSDDADTRHEATLMLNPIAAKLLARNLNAAVAGYEQTFGEIKMPANLGLPENPRG